MSYAATLIAPRNCANMTGVQGSSNMEDSPEVTALLQAWGPATVASKINSSPYWCPTCGGSRET